MTEQTPSPGPDEPDDTTQSRATPADAPTTEGHAPPPSTGVPAVDAVLAEIDGLDDLPLDQHLPAFERAHQALRTALDAADVPTAEPTDHGGDRSGDPAADPRADPWVDPAADEPA